MTFPLGRRLSIATTNTDAVTHDTQPLVRRNSCYAQLPFPKDTIIENIIKTLDLSKIKSETAQKKLKQNIKKIVDAIINKHGTQDKYFIYLNHFLTKPLLRGSLSIRDIKDDDIETHVNKSEIAADLFPVHDDIIFKGKVLDHCLELSQLFGHEFCNEKFLYSVIIRTYDDYNLVSSAYSKIMDLHKKLGTDNLKKLISDSKTFTFELDDLHNAIMQIPNELCSADKINTLFTNPKQAVSEYITLKQQEYTQAIDAHYNKQLSTRKRAGHNTIGQQVTENVKIASEIAPEQTRVLYALEEAFNNYSSSNQNTHCAKTAIYAMANFTILDRYFKTNKTGTIPILTSEAQNAIKAIMEILPSLNQYNIRSCDNMTKLESDLMHTRSILGHEFCKEHEIYQRILLGNLTGTDNAGNLSFTYPQYTSLAGYISHLDSILGRGNLKSLLQIPGSLENMPAIWGATIELNNFLQQNPNATTLHRHLGDTYLAIAENNFKDSLLIEQTIDPNHKYLEHHLRDIGLFDKNLASADFKKSIDFLIELYHQLKTSDKFMQIHEGQFTSFMTFALEYILEDNKFLEQKASDFNNLSADVLLRQFRVYSSSQGQEYQPPHID